ncbi:MFS family permease [Streptomyces sp. SAI-135]|jgi:MFS family permease|uniref:MFS transporter n=1 Tax=unclassified Streptomyces TaxID=2593676 RepID=UPI0024750970|nr:MULTISPECIES: MFS transporter [unclassified Streptomyces]MDH6523170.1 MFS family permease [Streptomyces sp. SAI-090]MDH6574055.1 MFS family permease [Streptomyces sp. SAI-117]MDH6581209.1 MFS family permease [Streptomyces sp. SAI-133]MDH6613216.1 MFS family permease [Streptomyces sp. SAI-135]
MPFIFDTALTITDGASTLTYMSLGTRSVLPVACYVVLLVSALQTLFVPVIAAIQADLGVSTSLANWAVTANLLAAAVLTPVVGRLGDLYGRRPVMAGVLSVVLLGSVLAATTSSLALLLVARVAQAASYGLFPLSIGVLREELPPKRLTGAMVVTSGMLSVGAGAGLVVTGLLMRGGGDYHNLFWLSTALAAIGLAGVLLLPRRPGAASGSLDWAGAALLGLGLVLLILPLEEGNGWGWGSARVLGSLGAAVVALFAFVLVEQRVTSPLVSVQILSRRPIVVANAVGLFLGFSLFAVFLSVTMLVQTSPAVAGYGFDASVFSASLVYLLPASASGVVSAPMGGRLVARFGARATLVIAAALAGIGFVMLAVLHSATWQVIVGALLVGTAVTFGYATLPALINAHVEPADTTVANSVNSIARSVGMSLGTAFVVTLTTRNPIPGPVPIPREEQFVAVFVFGAVLAVICAATVRWFLPLGRQATPAATLRAGAEGKPAAFPARPS